MARVTVEDCIEKVKNRFELVLMAAKRAKDIDRGAVPSVTRDNDKPTIIALREIADEALSLEGLRELAKRSTYENILPSSDKDEQSLEDEEDEQLTADMSGDDEDEEDSEELEEEDLKALEELDSILDEDEEQ